MSRPAAGRVDTAGAVVRLAVRAALAAAILGFVPGLLDSFAPPKAAALRAIGLPLLLFVALEGAWRGRAFRLRALDGVVLAWIAAAALSTALGISPRLSWIGEIEQREGLATLLALAGLHYGARRGHAHAGHARGTLTVAIACAALAAAYAMAQRAGLDPLAWEQASSYPTAAGPVLRVFGPLGNAILLGAVLAAALALGLARALAPGRRGPWLLPALVLVSAAIAATLSRGAFLAAGAGAVAALGMVGATWGSRLVPRMAGTLGAVGLPAAAWAFVALRAPIAARIAESVDPRAESTPARIEIARSAYALWRERPWLGVGPDAFGLAFPAAQTEGYWRNGWIGMPAHAHSAALQAIATGGGIALLVGAAWLALLARLLARRPADGDAERNAVAAGLVALAVAGAVNTVGLAGAALFVTLSALAASLADEAPPADPAPGRAAVVAAVAALVLVVALAAPAVPELRALRAAHRARAALIESTRATPEVRAALTAASLESARRATALAPAEDELWRLHADAALAQAPAGDSPAAEAERAARRALALEPRRASNLVRLANALSVRGEHDRAEAAFDAAERLAPQDALLLVDRVRAELRAGRAGRAYRTALRLTGLYPEEAIGHSIEAGVLITLGRPVEAQDALARALASRWEEGSDPQREAAGQALRILREGAAPADSGPKMGLPAGAPKR